MAYTMKVTKEMATAQSTLSVSPKHALTICRTLNRKTWNAAKANADGLADQSRSLTGKWKGKYYSKAAGHIAILLNTLAANARHKALEPEEMQLLISAHEAPTMWRGRRKRKFGMRMKLVKVHAILRPAPAKKTKPAAKAAPEAKK